MRPALVRARAARRPQGGSRNLIRRPSPRGPAVPVHLSAIPAEGSPQASSQTPRRVQRPEHLSTNGPASAVLQRPALSTERDSTVKVKTAGWIAALTGGCWR